MSRDYIKEASINIKDYLKKQHSNCVFNVKMERYPNEGDGLLYIQLFSGSFVATSKKLSQNHYLSIDIGIKPNNLKPSLVDRDPFLSDEAKVVFKDIITYISKLTHLMGVEFSFMVSRDYLLLEKRKKKSSNAGNIPDITTTDKNSYKSKRAVKTLEGSIVEGIFKSIR